jgi:hypothetical protein
MSQQGGSPQEKEGKQVAKFYKVEFDGKIIVRSSANREFRYAVIFGNHWIPTGYASFCGSFDAAQKTHESYMKKYFDNYFMIMPTTEITEAEYKAIKAKINLIKQALVEAN